MFKKGQKTDPSNYRRISLLLVVSMIIEKVVHDQYNYQSGFRVNHSTNLCLSFLTDKILKGFDEGLLTGMILIDLQKHHEILLQQLKAIRSSKGTLQWFRSYLSEQIFLVNNDSKLSDFGKISFEVPQGSILGSLLFLIYVNDMPEAVESTLLLYADD